MLHEFIDLNRDVIISRTRDRVRSRPWPSVAPGEVEHGVPLFLTQLSETLRLEDLLHKAFKNTPPGGRVVLRARAEHGRLRIETEDECGGIPPGKGDLFQKFGDRRGGDRSGLGLGLSIARKAVRAHAGEISFRNLPGKGCIFIIDVPLAAAETAPQSVS